MTVAGVVAWTAAGSAVWLLVGLLTALAVGRAIRLADAREAPPLAAGRGTSPSQRSAQHHGRNAA